jgi:hypothetical protein
MKKSNTKFYKDSNGLLYSKSLETKVVRLRTTTDKAKVIQHVDFLEAKLDLTEIKREEFSRLMNIYFKDIHEEWEYNGEHFRSLDNFTGEGSSLISNYDFKSLPKHDCGVYGTCLLVYHCGRLYYFTLSYNGYKSGQLLDMKRQTAVRWAQAKHCAPIVKQLSNNKSILL